MCTFGQNDQRTASRARNVISEVAEFWQYLRVENRNCYHSSTLWSLIASVAKPSPLRPTLMVFTRDIAVNPRSTPLLQHFHEGHIGARSSGSNESRNALLYRPTASVSVRPGRKKLTAPLSLLSPFVSHAARSTPAPRTLHASSSLEETGSATDPSDR